jgi:hypothetical protein
MSDDYTVLIADGAYEIGRRGSELIAACACGSGMTAPDKGLGRARIYSWQTCHRDCAASS